MRLNDRQKKSFVFGAGDGTFDTPGLTFFMSDHFVQSRGTVTPEISVSLCQCVRRVLAAAVSMRSLKLRSTIMKGENATEDAIADESGT